MTAPGTGSTGLDLHARGGAGWLEHASAGGDRVAVADEPLGIHGTLGRVERTLLSQVIEEVQAAIGTTDVNIRHFVSGAEGVEETAEDADITSYLVAYCNGLNQALEIVACAVDELRRSQPDAPTASD